MPRVAKLIVNPALVPDKGQTSRTVALFAPDGSVLVAVKKQAAQADSVAADITAMKVDFNALLAKLRLAGILS